MKGVEIIIAPLALTIDPVLPNDEHLALLTAVCKKWQKKKTLTKARHSLQLEKYLTKIRSIQDRYRSESIALGNDPATEITPYESIHLDLLLGLNDNLDAKKLVFFLVQGRFMLVPCIQTVCKNKVFYFQILN